MTRELNIIMGKTSLLLDITICKNMQELKMHKPIFATFSDRHTLLFFSIFRASGKSIIDP